MVYRYAQMQVNAGDVACCAHSAELLPRNDLLTSAHADGGGVAVVDARAVATMHPMIQPHVPARVIRDTIRWTTLPGAGRNDGARVYCEHRDTGLAGFGW